MTHEIAVSPDQRPTGGLDARQPWVVPTIAELPRLTDLTLQTLGPPIDGGGGTGGGGSGVFP